MFVYLLTVWSFQWSWYEFVKISKNAVLKMDMNGKAITFAFDGGSHPPAGYTKATIRPVIVSKHGGGKKFADFSHLIVQIGETIVDVIATDSNAPQVRRRSIDKQKPQKSVSFYVPFFNYGIVGVTSINDELVAAICDNWYEKCGALEQSKRLHPVWRSCQEFALEIAKAALEHSDNLFHKRHFNLTIQPFTVIGETKTILKTLVILLATYLLPLWLLWHLNVDLTLSYN